MKLIGNIASGILIFFGVLFVWGAFSSQGQIGWILIGIITIGIGFGLLLISNHKKNKPLQSSVNATYKLDLPANVSVDTLKCKSCGGSLKIENIQMIAGAPIVNCPYCHSSYQMTEQPKW